MDGVRNKKTRSSTRQNRSATSNKSINESTVTIDNNNSNPFEELMKEQNGSANDIYMNYTSVIEDDKSNRMVHFEDHQHHSHHHHRVISVDDIPSMLIAASGDPEKYNSHQSTTSVMRMGFGNMNLRRDGPIDLVSDVIFDDEEHLGIDGGEDDEDGTICGSGSVNGTTGSVSFGSTSADLRAAIVSNWLTDHYEPQENISLPRSVLYDHYLEFCQSQGTEPVNSATFGKIIRSVFPTLRTRRLGTRGNSKYHYFGIGLKTDLLGNDQYSNIYAQYSRPPPSRPRNSKRDRAHNSNSDHFSFGSSTYSTSSGAAASHVYSASCAKGSSASRSRRSGSSSGSGGGRRSRRNRQSSVEAMTSVGLLDEQGAEALLLGQHGLISSQSNGNPSGNSSTGAFRSLSGPNYDDFAHFLEQICSPVFSNVPPHVTFESVQAFSLVYQQHIIDLLRAISSHEFAVVEGLSEMFWMNFPPEMLTCLHCDESLRIVAIADDYLYQVLIHTLIPDVLEPIPIGITQNVRQFSKFLEGILRRTLQSPIPTSIIEVKLDAAKRFCQVLRRRTSLSHLTQAIRSILCNAEQTHQMLLDWGQVDFPGIKEQCDWIMRLKEGFLHWIEASFRTYLQDGVSLHVWSTWIESIAEQCINGEQVMGSSLEEACSTVIMRWTFYSSLIMRDLTLRSAASFGSFHLLNLLFNEYLLYSIEKRLDDHRRSVGLMSFWPNGNEKLELDMELNNHNNTDELNPTAAYANNNTPAAPYNNATASTHNNAVNQTLTFDDFFRKSAVLGPTSSPVINPATRNILLNDAAVAGPCNNNNNNLTTTNTINPSSPLGTKQHQQQQKNNNPPNKENALI